MSTKKGTTGTPADHDATMAVTTSMILPALDPNATMAITPDMVVDQNDATMMLTPEMVVNDASIVMGRDQIERALQVVSLWHAALARGDLPTMLGTLAEDVELLGPRGTTRGHAAFRDWFAKAGFTAMPKRRFCGGLGHVVVEQAAKWRERDGEIAGTIASAFVVRNQKIVKYERFDELQAALTMYGLRDVHEIVRKR
jgi:ketosteroid isomerase-like protein